MRTIFVVFSLLILSIRPSYANLSHTNPESLQNIIFHVYENNPALKAAREELKQTQELYPQASANWFPTITAEASLFATNIESANFSNGTGATTKDFTLNLNQSIWRGGQTFSETERAIDLICAGRALLKAREQDILLEAITAYINALHDKKLLNLRLESEDIFLQELKVAQERFELGDTTQTDVDQAQSRLLRAKSERIDAHSNFDIARATLEKITGQPSPEIFSAPLFHLSIPENLDELLSIAKEHSPDLDVIHFESHAANHDIDTRFRALLPQISGFASINKQYDPQPGIVAKGQTETIGLRASLTLFEGGAQRSRIRESRYAAKEQEYKIQETWDQIERDVILNWRRYTSTKNQLKSRTLEIKAAEKALEGTREEAQIGQRTLLDILDGDEDILDAKTALNKAKREKTIAQFSLARSLGMLDLATFTTHSE